MAAVQRLRATVDKRLAARVNIVNSDVKVCNVLVFAMTVDNISYTHICAKDFLISAF